MVSRMITRGQCCLCQLDLIPYGRFTSAGKRTNCFFLFFPFPSFNLIFFLRYRTLHWLLARAHTHAKTELNLVRMVNWQNICSEYVNRDPLLNLGDRLFLFVRMERASRISMFTENCILKSRSLYHIQPTAISHSKQKHRMRVVLKEVSVAIGSLFIVISILYE